MNLTLRPSGGRGEYELAGRQGDLLVHDLFGLPILIEVIPGAVIDAFSRCVLKDGKPRIRLTQTGRNAHPASLIAAAMMLPKPRRSRAETHGSDLLVRDQFVVQTIRLNVVRRFDGVLISPVIVRLENGDDVKRDIDFAQRMSRVVKVWGVAATGDGPLCRAVNAHAAAFTSDDSSQRDYHSAYTGLRDALGGFDGDMLPEIERLLGIVESSFDSAIEAGDSEGMDVLLDENSFISPTEARIERVKKWRLAAVRGGSAADFRKKVQEAYNTRCVFSGQRLPRMDVTSSAGVDAAHILPWIRYDIDTVGNGLCLSKQCHWAFDEGVLRLKYDETENSYVVYISDKVKSIAPDSGFDLEAFESVCGLVPRERLPHNEHEWPSLAYIQELNKFLDSEAA